MVRRTQKLSKNNNLFLFGARGTGKSTLLTELFGSSRILWINFLTESDEEIYGDHPDALSRHLAENEYDYVVIDEVQKHPKILDIVHQEIETKKTSKPYFILTGSSARKLKRSSGNLLGGRALTYFLFPFTHQELGADFNLQEALQYGTLPIVWNEKESEKKEDFLRGYVRNYIKEEILVEQLLRKIDPFKDFLEVAAQMNGEILNYSKISHDVGVSDQTVKSFFQILEDTLLGFHLPPFHRSIRKRQRESPKFYFIDTGLQRALSRTLKIPLSPMTSEYGKCFEHWIVIEIMKQCEYEKNDFKLSYLRTKDDAEIDLIIERPAQKDLMIEIKSTSKITQSDTKTISKFLKDWDKPAEAQVWSNDPLSQKNENVRCLHWQQGFAELFTSLRK